MGDGRTFDGSGPAEEQQTETPRARTSRAVRLLEQLIARGLDVDDALAHGLGVSSRRLEECRSGFARMPLHAQRRLADLIVRYVPELVREGRRLQLQCEAEEAFNARETATHILAPPDRFR